MKSELEMTVLASRVRESAREVKSKVSEETSVEVMVPFKMLVLVITPVPINPFVKVKVAIEAESKS